METNPFLKILKELADAQVNAIHNAKPQQGVVEMVEVRPGHYEREKK